MANINKVIKVAEKEVGYLEKSSKSQLEDKTDNAGKNNYTKYWADLAPGYQGQPWCNCFVNWVFVEAYGEVKAKKLLCTDGGWSYYTPTSAQYFKNKGQWHSTPEVGDVIYFKNNTRICHVGLVYKVDSSKVYTIEGNTSGGNTLIPNGGGVAKKSYSLSYSAIAGYGRPAYGEKAKTKADNKKESGYTGEFPKKTVKINSKGSDAKKLQKFLNWYQDYKLIEDGVCGPKTNSAIKDFQRREGLVVDGVFGAKSLAKAKTIKK